VPVDVYAPGAIGKMYVGVWPVSWPYVIVPPFFEVPAGGRVP